MDCMICYTEGVSRMSIYHCGHRVCVTCHEALVVQALQQKEEKFRCPECRHEIRINIDDDSSRSRAVLLYIIRLSVFLQVVGSYGFGNRSRSDFAQTSPRRHRSLMAMARAEWQMIRSGLDMLFVTDEVHSWLGRYYESVPRLRRVAGASLYEIIEGSADRVSVDSDDVDQELVNSLVVLRGHRPLPEAQVPLVRQSSSPCRSSKRSPRHSSRRRSRENRRRH
ncbi:uncharacterized protein [Watersipora subatra]|uniref:uncharacterized protein n=1 Tax=Watersipora subatra TaxID=2589382 RepID=UPI00355BE154